MVLVGKDGVIVGLARVRAPLDPLVVIVAREHNDVVVAWFRVPHIVLAAAEDHEIARVVPISDPTSKSLYWLNDWMLSGKRKRLIR
jgi:hypothetical protein